MHLSGTEMRAPGAGDQRAWEKNLSWQVLSEGHLSFHDLNRSELCSVHLSQQKYIYMGGR